ncbi:MAG TPA: radical SAM protein [Syntrophorhabdales bacterium]|nr:radical SAM protein [Syntrophorhabdales bacterium]
MKHLRALLINPYIYDVSAYSFWSVPLGLLYVGSVLRENGVDVQLIDCLAVDEAKRKADGRAPFIRAKVGKPESAGLARKRFKRYGISPDLLRSRLRAMEPPDFVLVTTVMTYWYPGAAETVLIAKEAFPKAKVVVGGLYPSLCHGHAERHLEADLVVTAGTMRNFYAYVEEARGISLPFKPDTEDLVALPYPCLDLYESLPFAPLLTSLGCPYRCTYCATRYLHPRILRRPPEHVLQEVAHWTERGCRRFVLYDDSFLYDRETYAKPLLRAICRLPHSVSFHNPNALNASLIDEETAALLAKAGFSEIRIGLETADPHLQAAIGGKVDARSFEKAVGFLLRAGLEGRSICVYALAGLPYQRASDVKATVDYIAGLGLRPSLAHYSPIPHTPMFEAYHAAARFPIAEEPMFQNNSLFPFAWEGFTEEEMDELKSYVRERNASLG